MTVRAAATALVVTIAAVFYTLGQTKIYEASATVMFDPNPPRPLGRQVDTVVDLGSGNSWDNREYYETQYIIIRSMSVGLAVVGELGLDHDAAYLQNLPPGEKPQQRAEVLPETVSRGTTHKFEPTFKG